MNELNEADIVHRIKNNPTGKAKGKKGGNITQEVYVKLILPYIEKRKGQLEKKDKRFILQEDNDKGHGATTNMENPARMAKIRINLDWRAQI